MLDGFTYTQFSKGLEDLKLFSKMNRNVDRPLYLKTQVDGYSIENTLSSDTDPDEIVAIAVNGKVFSAANGLKT